MNFSRDDRGVSEVLGAILVFALLISVLSIVQVSGVPALNEQVEFEHNAGLQDDMRGFSASVDAAAATGVNQPVVIDTGVRYPPRLFLLNPGPTAGTLSTTGDTNVGLANVSAVNPETRDYLNGTVPYNSTGLVYEPRYNVYTAAPETRYEHGAVYNVDRRSGNVAVLDPGSLVSGRRISLTMLDGQLASSGGDAVSFGAVPTSAPTTVVSVTNNQTGRSLTLAVETNLSEQTWRTDLLSGEIDTDGADGGIDDGRYVTGVRCTTGAADTDPCNGTIVLTFEEGYTYDLRLAEVSIDGTSSPKESAYVTTIPSLDREISENGGTVGAAVRDQYGNPVSGATVEFWSPVGFFDNKNVTTDADGIATTRFDPGTNVSSTTIWAGINRNGGDGANPLQNEDPEDHIRYGVSVTEANEPSTAGDINPVGDDALVLRNVTLTDANYTLAFENTGKDDLYISQARVNFYFVSTPGNAETSGDGTGRKKNLPPTYAIITSGTSPTYEASATIRGGFESFDDGNIQVAGGGMQSIQIDFFNDDGPFGNANSDDYFILTLMTNGSPRTYFVVPGLSTDSSSTPAIVFVGDTNTVSDRLMSGPAKSGVRAA